MLCFFFFFPYPFYYCPRSESVSCIETLASFLAFWSLVFNWLPSKCSVLNPSTSCSNAPCPWKAALQWAQLVLPAQACQRVSLHTAAPFLQREGWAFVKGCRHGTMSDNLQHSVFVWFKTEFGPLRALRWGTNALILRTLKASENRYH